MIETIIIQIINFAIMVFAIVPAVSFFRKYKELQLTEFQYMSFIFICTSLTAFGALGGDALDWLIFYQIQYLSLQIIYFVLFGLSMRMYFEKTPRLLQIFSYLWFGSLTIITLLWQKKEQMEQVQLIFWDVNRASSTHRSNGAGLYYGDAVIYSTSHNLLIVIFIGYCLIWFLFSLLSITPVIQSDKIKKAHKLWKVSTILNLVWVIFMLPWTPNTRLVNGLVVVMLGIITYIVYKIPEGMILSNAQITRSYSILVDIHDKVNAKQLDQSLGMSNFLSYIELLVDHPELKDKIELKLSQS